MGQETVGRLHRQHPVRLRRAWTQGGAAVHPRWLYAHQRPVWVQKLLLLSQTFKWLCSDWLFVERAKPPDREVRAASKGHRIVKSVPMHSHGVLSGRAIVGSCRWGFHSHLHAEPPFFE